MWFELGHLLLLGLLGEEDSLNVWQDTTLGNGDSGEKFVQLFVVTDGELKMSRDDPSLLVVAGSVASELEDLSGEVLHDGGQVDGSSGTNALSIVALAEETVNTSHGELEASPVGTALCLSLDLAALAASRHDELKEVGSSYTAN